MKRIAVTAAAVLAVLGGLFWLGYYLTHNVDWARVIYKRYKAENAYVFDEINPMFEKTNPAKLIRIRTRESADRIRQNLTTAIWGPAGLPRDAAAEPYAGNAPDSLRNLPGVASIRIWRIPVDLGYAAYMYVLEPAKPNGRLVVYQHGYAGHVESMTPLFKRLLAAGYTVAASNYPEYGPNRFPHQNLERFGWYTLSHDRVVSVHPHPLRFYIEPVVAFLNTELKGETYKRVDIVGFSAGGWIATLVAAVDSRIARTISVAGGYPMYLRLANFERESPPPQIYGPLLQAANYLEMYVLAAEGEARALTQIFNRYDRCCYRNTLGRLYEPAVRDTVAGLGAGRFQVLIDETHADHKVSDWAIARILESLSAP